MKAFVATVDQGSFTKEADFLNLSKPVLTRLVAGLEKNLGEKLLRRSKRSHNLTEVGASYLTTCRTVFSLLDEAESELAQKTVCPKGRLEARGSEARGSDSFASVYVCYLSLIHI